jgi:hypothetical protein
LDESNKAYDDLLIAFDKIPVLHFLEPKKEIFLETDAFEHGIGAYLNQLIDGQ